MSSHFTPKHFTIMPTKKQEGVPLNKPWFSLVGPKFLLPVSSPSPSGALPNQPAPIGIDRSQQISKYSLPMGRLPISVRPFLGTFCDTLGVLEAWCEAPKDARPRADSFPWTSASDVRKA